jgi:hypothetical protein
MRKSPGQLRVPVSGLLVLFLTLFSIENLYCQNSNHDFESMKGTFFTHAIIDNSDSLSSKVITELRDEMGVPLWFSRDFFLTVCLNGLCRMVSVKIYWTGAATYLALQSPENEPLTKTDHTKFKPDDYQKLDMILSDSLSVLKRFKIEELTIEPVSKKVNPVDAHSGATEPSLSGYTVKDAVYTCYALWHAVYGPTKEKISSLLDQRADRDYLKLVMARKNQQYILWAIDFIKRNPRYHQAFYPEIMSFINSENIDISKYALGYFTPALLSDVNLQNDLARVMEETSLQKKFEIISKFSTLPRVNNDIIVNLLGQYENKKISTTMLGYVCEMIKPENMEDVRVRSKIQSISKDENQYVRNITLRLLSYAGN